MSQAYTRTETVQSGQVTGTLTDFVALLSRTHNDFRTIGNGGHVANANGYDLLLYSDSGLTTLLKQETEKYDAATGQVVKWAKVASIATSTVVYWGYGDTGISTSQDDLANLWDSSTFAAVYHLGDGSTISAADSSTFGLTGSNQSATASAGKIFGGVSVTGGSHFRTGSGTALRPWLGDFTVSVWVIDSGFSGYQAMYDNHAGSRLLSLFIAGATTRYYGLAGNSGDPGGSGASFVENVWTYQTWTRSGSSNVWRLNGVTGVSFTQGATNSSTDSIDFGANPSGGGNAWAGQYDEIRFRYPVLSADHITAEYNNQNAPTSFWSLGSEEAVGGGADIELEAAVSASASVTAALTTGIQLAATPSASAATAAALTTYVPLAAAAAGSGVTTASLTTIIQLVAAATGGASTTADLSTGIALAAAPSATGSASADLTTQILLEAAPSASATIVAALNAAIVQLEAAPSASASTTADLTTAIQLAAAAQGSATTTADLSTAIQLAAAAAGGATVTASMTADIALVAAATASASTTAVLTTAIVLVAAPTGSASTTAALTTSIALAATATGTAVVVAVLTQIATPAIYPVILIDLSDRTLLLIDLVRNVIRLDLEFLE